MPSSLTLITPPASEPITLAEAKAHLRVAGDEEDTVIAAMLTAARLHTEKVLGRSLLAQTWRATLDAFPGDGCTEAAVRRTGESYVSFEARRRGIVLPNPPIVSVTSVVYDAAADGTATTLAADQYRLTPDAEPGLLVPAYGVSWPATRSQPGAVRVTYAAGYASVAAVPDPVKAYVKLLLGSMFEHREATVTGMITAQLGFADRLLDNYRIH